MGRRLTAHPVVVFIGVLIAVAIALNGIKTFVTETAPWIGESAASSSATLPNRCSEWKGEGFNNQDHAARRYSWIRPPSTSLCSTGVGVAPGTWAGRMPAGTARPRPRWGRSST